jgi:hypothetical protein
LHYVGVIHLGYEVGGGAPVEIPLRHMVVTGQTQEAGKTTTLEAMIARSGVKAIAFVTKRGEGSFAEARSSRRTSASRPIGNSSRRSLRPAGARS